MASGTPSCGPTIAAWSRARALYPFISASFLREEKAMLQSHWNITGERRYVEFKEGPKEANKPAASSWYAGIPASPPVEPDPPVYPEPPRRPEIPPDKEPRPISDPPPDVLPVPAREPPATPGLVARWRAESAAVIPISRIPGASRRNTWPAQRRSGDRLIGRAAR